MSKKSSPRLGRPAGSDRTENTNRILAAALSCFAQKGYAATSFADISQSVGFTRSAIYAYYPNKVALYHALLDSIQEEHIATLQPVISSNKPFLKKLELFVNALLQDHLIHPDRSTFLASSPIEITRHKELARDLPQHASTPALLHELLTQAIHNGDIRKGFAANDVLVCILGSLMGMSLLQRSMNTENANDNGSMEKAVDVMIAMIEGKFVM